MNLFELPPLPSSPILHSDPAAATELTEVLARGSGGVRIERIVSTGQISDWYDQTETEFVALLAGSAIVQYDDGAEVYLQAGDTLLIAPHQRHRVAYTSTEPPAVWLCVFY